MDDSVTQREILRRLLISDGEFQVVGEARNGREAVQLAAERHPDLVLMDIHMPDMDGVTATREIMNRTPVPIVIASASLKRQDIDVGMQALQAGAVAVIEKPQGAVLLHLEEIAPSLRRELLAASTARVARRPPPAGRAGEKSAMATVAPPPFDGISVIGMCASTGGPPVLLEILSQIPRPFPLPVLLVQHIADGFVEGFSRWLGDVSGQPVSLATSGQRLSPGVWLSPGGRHLTVGAGARIFLSDPAGRELHCPSANALLTSLARNSGTRALGIILTGMGSDGAEGMAALRLAGGRTIAQDEQSSLIYGMPRMAVERGAVELQLNPREIATTLTRLAETSQQPDSASMKFPENK